MLQFVLGRAGSGKTEYVRRMLADRAVAGDGRCVMLVPEQYSFETEKAMLRLAGAQRANAIGVYSFTRLAETVFRREGGVAGRRLSDGGRRILMSAAVEACQEHLEVYRSAAQGGRVTDLMLTAVNEMKMCGVGPKELFAAAEQLRGRGLGRKVYELGLLFETYEALVAASYLDSRDDLTRLAAALEESAFFAGCTVAVDSFEGFTVQELRVLGQVMRRAETVVVSLCTDGQGDGAGLFALVDRTRARLERLAGDMGVRVAPPVMLTEAPRFLNENLKLVEAGLFCGGEGLMAEDAEGVTLYRARDVYQESEFVAATIRRLVMERGWRYRDISIICRDPRHYYGSLDVALKKRDIPCFMSQPMRVDAEPVTRFVLGAFQCVQSGFATDCLLELLKTGVSGFTAEEISDLENYAFLWKISGGGWREDFVRHPQGFGREFTEEDREALGRLNGLRARLVGPLLRFAAATRDATGEEISEAVYGLLTGFGLEETLPAYCRELERAGEEGLAARQVRVWELLMELLDQMHSLLGSRKVTRERYSQLLREVVAAEDVSEIPQTVDQVLFGTAEQVRQSSPRAVFLIGVVQGEFPLAPRSSGVFSDAERRALLEMELPLGDPLEKKAMEERYLAYSVACGPSEALYISWPCTAGGEDREPSELVAGVRALFPGLEPVEGLPEEYFADSYEAAFSIMAPHLHDPSPQAGALRMLFAEGPDYRGRVEALERAAGRGEQRVEDPELARQVYGERLFVSPTQVENFYSCRFKYFCRYGLNAKERRPAEMDVMQYGTLMHYLFEQVFHQPKEVREGWSEEELAGVVWGHIEAYAQENLGGMGLLSGRQRYRLGRMAQSACKLIRHVEQELAQSRFAPEHLELGLGEDREYPPLRVETGTGRTVTVGGTIDRVDVYHSPSGQDYVRVIDYKTGRKMFKLADVLHGLNMQMLVYLAALVEGGQAFPAGILYMPAAEPTVSAGRGEDESSIQGRVDKMLRMNGVVLADTEIIQAMEDGAKGRFIPAALNKDGSLRKGGAQPLTGEQLGVVLAYSKKLIAAMGRELLKGAAQAQPNLKNHNACKLCPYGPVCGSEKEEKDVEADATTQEEALEQMRAALREGGGVDAGNEMDGGPAGCHLGP